jgi:hypothetical protein
VPQLVVFEAGKHVPPALHPAVQFWAELGQPGAGPGATGLHVPTPLRSQRLQVPQAVLPQHTPSTQFPLPQSWPVVQVSPLGRPMQEPLLQILPVPQLVPFPTFPVAVQTEVPVAHEVAPVWQTFPPGVQGWFAVQLTHVPAEQTLFVPQLMPLATLLGDPQTLLPVAHEVVPVWQRFPPGLHVWLGVHALHVPPEQYRLLPHEVPFATSVPASVQTGAPLAQLSVPLWQGPAGGVQGVPAAQALHDPALHTLPDPHGVPSATLPVFAQTDVPVVHEVAPTWQTFPPGMHDWFATQATHVPAEQTLFVPQLVPLATLVGEPQTLLPVAHEVVPV